MANKSRNEARLKRHNRVRKNIYGVAERPRMCVYRSLSDIYVQVIDDERGMTLVSSSSLDKELKGKLKGKTKTEKAVEVGKLVAQRAKDKKITSVPVEIASFPKTCRVIGKVIMTKGKTILAKDGVLRKRIPNTDNSANTVITLLEPNITITAIKKGNASINNNVA